MMQRANADSLGVKIGVSWILSLHLINPSSSLASRRSVFMLHVSLI